MWIEVKKILPFYINKLGLGPVLEFNRLFVNWDKILVEIFEENYRNKSKPISLKDKVLEVDCLNSIWASELRFKQAKIIKKINQDFNKEIVREIKLIS